MSETRIINEYQRNKYDSSYDFNKKTISHYADVLQLVAQRDQIRVLDIGGGNGCFAHMVADFFSGKNVEIIVLDNVSYGPPVSGEVCKFINDSVLNLPSIFENDTFDIVFFNGVLHHLVFDSWRETQNNLNKILNMVSLVLKADGYLCVREERAESYFVDGVASFIIYKVTSCRNKLVVAICKRLDGKSAGVGVRFLSDQSWRKHFEDSGFHILKTYPGEKRKLKWYMPVFLLLKEYYFHVYYIMQKRT